jgi:hypothetical protein
MVYNIIMAEGTAEQPQQQNPDQEKDPRIAEVRKKLTEDARLIAQYPENPESPYGYRYVSDDESHEVWMGKMTLSSRKPATEAVQPQGLETALKALVNSDARNTPVSEFAWIIPDDKLTVLQAVDERGRPSLNLDGQDKLIENPVLRESILKSVSSGKRSIIDIGRR